MPVVKINLLQLTLLPFCVINPFNHYVGNFSDWLNRKQKLTELDHHEKSKNIQQDGIEKIKKITKLSYKEQRALNALPDEIKQLEIEKNTLEEKISSSSFYTQDKKIIQSTMEELNLLTQKIETKTDVWSDLIEKEELYKKTKNS